MINKRLILSLLATLLIAPLAWSQQERALRPVTGTVDSNIRQALVIGNSEYRHAGRLRNPVNDARAVGSTLQQLGFDVTLLTDADQRKMERTIREFGDQLRQRKGVGLFYYAGHGMQFDGENYLLPTDINPSTEDDVRYDAVPLGKMLAQMRAADNAMNVVILDACRNNPFSRSFRTFSPGLAQVNAAAGTFISFATAPGQVAADGSGDNGLFTSKLLEHIVTPGIQIEEVFKRTTADVYRVSNERQAPWVQYSVIGDFFFVSKTLKQPEFNQITKENSKKTVDNAPRVSKTMEKQWAEWQEKMELAYKNTVRVVRNYDSSQLKISAWQSFLRNWNSDNQYSQQDEELRKIASDQLSQLLSKSEKSMDSPIKKGGISEKIEPEISIINNLKTTDKWTEWQLRMQEDFDERVKFESQPVLNYLKKNSWDSFLEKWIEDNPFSDEDDSLRQRANLKAKSYSLKKNIPNNSVADWEKLLPKPDSKIRTAIGKSLDLRNKQIEKIQNPKSVEDQIGNSQNSSLNKNQAYSSRDIVKQNLNQFLLKQAVKEYETKSRRAPQIYDEEKRWRDRMGFITDEDQDSIKSRFFQNLSEGCPNNSC